MVDQEEAYEVFLEHISVQRLLMKKITLMMSMIHRPYDVNFVSLTDMFSFLNEQEKTNLRNLRFRHKFFVIT